MRLVSSLSLAICLTPVWSLGCAGPPAGSEGERGDLGKSCTSSSQCGDGLFCDTSDPLFGLCTETCSRTQDCQLRYGLGSFCIGAERCVRECARETDCLEATNCDTEFRWCQ